MKTRGSGRHLTSGRALLAVTVLYFSITNLLGQSLPTGFPVVEERLRVEQVLGRFDSTISFAHRPIASGRFTELYGEVLSRGSDTIRTSRSMLDSKGFRLSLLPAQWDTEISSHHPEGYNNGSLIRSRGLQTRVAAGVHAKWWVLSVQLRPELIWAQNASYDGFVQLQDSASIERRYRLWNRVDLPERYGDRSYSELLPGQSSISIETKYVRAGLSSENIWWGPGQENSLIMTNNARGFYHFTIGTTQPANIGIGTLEGQLLVGRLDASGFKPTETTYDDEYYLAPTDDWRYMSAVNFVYQPKWIPKLYLGLNRAFQQYWQEAKAEKEFFPVLTGLFKTQRNDDSLSVDQLLSINGRYIWEKIQSEFYFEWGRNDAAFNLRDFVISPFHSQAYIFGMTKNVQTTNALISVNAEATHLERTNSHIVRPEPIWYQHGQVRQGYTHQGEVLGAGIGPGSNSQSLKVTRYRGLEQIGVQFHRREVQSDFTEMLVGQGNTRSKSWTDLTLMFNASKIWGKLLVYSELHCTASLNYQWNWAEPFPGVVTGDDAFNVLFRLRLSYL